MTQPIVLTSRLHQFVFTIWAIAASFSSMRLGMTVLQEDVHPTATWYLSFASIVGLCFIFHWIILLIRRAKVATAPGTGLAIRIETLRHQVLFGVLASHGSVAAMTLLFFSFEGLATPYDRIPAILGSFLIVHVMGLSMVQGEVGDLVRRRRSRKHAARLGAEDRIASTLGEPIENGD